MIMQKKQTENYIDCLYHDDRDSIYYVGAKSVSGFHEYKLPKKDLVNKIDEINADGRYKMIINAVSVVDADPALNISNLVLERVDALYEAGALEL